MVYSMTAPGTAAVAGPMPVEFVTVTLLTALMKPVKSRLIVSLKAVDVMPDVARRTVEKPVRTLMLVGAVILTSMFRSLEPGTEMIVELPAAVMLAKGLAPLLTSTVKPAGTVGAVTTMLSTVAEPLRMVLTNVMTPPAVVVPPWGMATAAPDIVLFV